MLGMLFRGVFLIGVLTWYSTNVWKLIDGYFRDQFRNYLEEEYRKNPRIKSDLQTAAAAVTATAGKVDPVATAKEAEPTTVAPSRSILETCESTGCPVEIAANDSTASSQGRERDTAREEEVTGGTSENEAAGGSTDKNAFLGTIAESKLENRKSPGNDQESLDSRSEATHRNDDDDDRDLRQKRREDRRSSAKRKNGKTNARSATPRDIPPREAGTPKKRTVKTITLTERDFVSVKDTSNDDFWEFEEDADRREPLQGVLVSQLPFRPRIDGVADLERVTADEYCPLTLEDETSCGETVKWP
ncbi:uncharacterized protein LOC143360832 [Halictus rubicundus]|uniref:uncharacterized protein LOC143360832 n=1 Tax=Halictus rubicundus TaxID=77578 RepID=UPI0040363B12